MQSGWDSRLEVALIAARLVEAEQRFEVRFRRRPSIRLASQRGDDLPGAGNLVGAGRWTARENLAPAGRVRNARGRHGTGDAELMQMGQRGHAGDGAGADVHQALLEHVVFVLDGAVEVLNEGGRNSLRAGLDFDRRRFDAVVGQLHGGVDVD